MFDRKEFLRLFWPVLVEQTLATTIGMVNTMMVSDVGVTAISAVSIVDSLNFVIMNLFIAFSTGATVVIAQRIGAKDNDKADQTAVQSAAASVMTAVLSGAAFIILGNQVINGLFGGAEPLVKSNAFTYLIFSAVSYPFLALFSISAGIMRASGNTRSPMRASIITNIVNAGVGAFFIYVFHLGVAGAGIALLCSRITGAGILFHILLKPDTIVGFRKISLKIDSQIIGPVIKIGLPACIDGLIFNGGKLLIQTLVTALGTISLAANSIAGSVSGLINIPGGAISIVAVTIVGQAVGAGIYGKELKKIFKSLIIYATVLLGALAIVTMPLLPVFVDLYSPPPEVKAIALSTLQLALALLPLTWPAAFILPSCIRSTGDSMFVTVASVMSMWFSRVLGAWYVVNFTNWGIFGIWVFWCVDWAVRGIAFLIRARTSRYINQPAAPQ